MVEETPGDGWDRVVGGHGDGLQGDSWNMQGRLEKFDRWYLVDIMPCGGELDEWRKDGGVGGDCV